jgi:hypothetical protein
MMTMALATKRRKQVQKKQSDDVAKDLISMVVAQVRKGSPKTKKKPTVAKQALATSDVSSDVAKPDELVIPESVADVTEQLRKFENMVIIQRLDTLIDMQKMQWEVLNRMASVIETMSVVGGDTDTIGEESSSTTNELDELIRQTEEQDELAASSPGDDGVKEDADGTPFVDKRRYEQAERFARKLGRVRNDVN